MKPPPFPISSRALAMIEEGFALADKDPKFARMVPALCSVSSRQSRTKTGEVFRRISVGHFIIGMYRPEQVSDWARFDVLGRVFAVHADVLQELRGKKLVVRAVASGYPDRHAETTKLLRAVPSRSRVARKSN